MKRATWALALLAALALAACTSSASTPQHTLTPEPTSPASVPPVTPTTTPATSASRPSTSSAKPLSPYEQDPAVKAIRAWDAQAARTINSGKYDDAALNAFMTPALAKQMKAVIGNSVGLRFPGPAPLTPVSVTAVSGDERSVGVCAVTSGWGVSKTTGKTTQKIQVSPVRIGVQHTGGRWLLDSVSDGNFSCKGVKMPGVKS